MRIKKSIKNLRLNKKTIAALNQKETKAARGGGGEIAYTGENEATCDGMHTCLVFAPHTTIQIGVYLCFN